MEPAYSDCKTDRTPRRVRIVLVGVGSLDDRFEAVDAACILGRSTVNRRLRCSGGRRVLMKTFLSLAVSAAPHEPLVGHHSIAWEYAVVRNACVCLAT